MDSVSVSLDDYYAEFVAARVAAGRFSSPEEVVRESLRLLEEREVRLDALRQALIQGESSGEAIPLDFNEIKREARRRAGLAIERA